MVGRTATRTVQLMNDAKTPFNAVNYDSFVLMVGAIGQRGLGLKPPSYQVKILLLKKEVDYTHDLMKGHKKIRQGMDVLLCVMVRMTRKRTLLKFLSQENDVYCIS